MKIEVPQFANKSQAIDWLITNKAASIAQKKSVMKRADAYGGAPLLVNEKSDASKAETVSADATKIIVRSIINTTKLMDSHDDVHVDQLWNKSLKDSPDNYLVNQHNFTFEGIISDDVKAFCKQIAWKDLGFDYEGNTQALIFDSVIDKAESPLMFDKYRTGKVKQHSVGMRYVSIKLAVNDERYSDEKATWDKYIDDIANKEDVEAQGYFWAITEAKVIEGSAVVKGSNFATPTTSVQQTKEAGAATSESIEPAEATQTKQYLYNANLI